MAQRDDISKLYESPAKLDSFALVLFWATAVLAFAATLLSDAPQSAVLIAQSITAVLFVIIDCANDLGAWYEAEKARRMHLIENSFGVHLTNMESSGYYNNQLEAGLPKAIVSTFESVFFSLNITKKMLVGVVVKALIALAAFLSIAMLPTNAAIYPIATQVIFSSYYVISAARTIVYRNRLQALYDSFYRELVTITVTNSRQLIALAADVEEYECVKAHYKVRLSSKVYDKMNPSLTKQWEVICSSIVIKETGKQSC